MQLTVPSKSLNNGTSLVFVFKKELHTIYAKRI